MKINRAYVLLFERAGNALYMLDNNKIADFFVTSFTYYRFILRYGITGCAYNYVDFIFSVVITTEMSNAANIDTWHIIDIRLFFCMKSLGKVALLSADLFTGPF